MLLLNAMLLLLTFFFFIEATSALDLESEYMMYSLLLRLDIPIVSVGHRPSLLRFHNRILTLHGPDRDAELRDIDISSSEQNRSSSNLFEAEAESQTFLLPSSPAAN
jgi:hypothetical protein